MTQTSISPGCGSSLGSIILKKKSLGRTSWPQKLMGSISRSPQSLRVSMACQCPGQRMVFSAKLWRWLRVKRKLGMPGVMAHSSISSTPHSANLKLSRPEVALTSASLPSSIIRTSTIYSRRTCSKDQVIMYCKGWRAADSWSGIPPTLATALSALTCRMACPRVTLDSPGANPMPSSKVIPASSALRCKDSPYSSALMPAGTSIPSLS